MNLDLLQWPAMVVTVFAAWFVASQQPRRRKIGFWLFLVSNVLWIVWGWQAQAQAWAFIPMQICLAALSIRGERKNSQEESLAQPARHTE